MSRPACQRFFQLRWETDPAGGRAELEEHLAACADCREWNALARRLEEGLRARPLPRPPAGLAGRITGRILAEQHARRRLRRGLRGALALAAGVLLVVLARSWQP